MNSDIKLVNNQLELEGDILIFKGVDIKFDNKDRRGTKNKSNPRRAMVHDHQDGLTINYRRDYPGGVTINDVKIEGSALEVKTTDIKLDNKGRRKKQNGHRRAMVHDFNDGLTLNFASDYPGGVTVNNGKIVNATLEGNVKSTGTLVAEKGLIVAKSGNLIVHNEAFCKDIRLSGLGYEPLTTTNNNGSILSPILPNIPLKKNKKAISLVHTIKEMQKQIAALEKKVKQLKAV